MPQTIGHPPARRLQFRPLHEKGEAEKNEQQNWDPRKTYEENIGYVGLFDRPEEDFGWQNPLPTSPQLQQPRKPSPEVRRLAAKGCNEDTEIAHVARGEFVVPQALQTPEVLAALSRAAAAYGMPLGMLNVGNAMNRINPNTGAAEFGVMDWISGLFNSDVEVPAAPRTSPGQPSLCRLPDGSIAPYRETTGGFGIIGGSGNGVGQSALGQEVNRAAQPIDQKPRVGIAGGGASGDSTSPASKVLRWATNEARFAPLKPLTRTASIGGSFAKSLPVFGSLLMLNDYRNFQNAPYCDPLA